MVAERRGKMNFRILLFLGAICLPGDALGQEKTPLLTVQTLRDFCQQAMPPQPASFPSGVCLGVFSGVASLMVINGLERANVPKTDVEAQSFLWGDRRVGRDRGTSRWTGGRRPHLPFPGLGVGCGFGCGFGCGRGLGLPFPPLPPR